MLCLRVKYATAKPAYGPSDCTLLSSCAFILQVNVVLMRGVNDDEVADFVELTRHDPINVRFIEYMPFDGNVWSTAKMVPYREMMQRVHER